MRQRAQSLAFDLGLDTPAAERADLTAVGKDQHCRPRLLRSAAARLDDGAVDAIAALFERLIQFCKQFTHDLMIASAAWRARDAV